MENEMNEIRAMVPTSGDANDAGRSPTVSSVIFAMKFQVEDGEDGASCEEVPEDGFFDRLMDVADGAWGLHVVPKGAIILPHFYRAASGALQRTGLDFCVCREYVVDEGVVLGASDPCGAFTERFVVRGWVIREVASVGDAPREAEKIIDVIAREYRGFEITSVLCVR